MHNKLSNFCNIRQSLQTMNKIIFNIGQSGNLSTKPFETHYGDTDVTSEFKDVRC